MTITERVKSGWTLLKFIRLTLGLLVLGSSVMENNIPGMVLGGLFTLIALLTDGVCCAGGACYAPGTKNKNTNPENIDYEELGK